MIIIVVSMIKTRRLLVSDSIIHSLLARRHDADAIEQNVFQLTPNRGLRTLRREMMPWRPFNLHTKKDKCRRASRRTHQPVEILSSFIVVDKRAGGHIAIVQQKHNIMVSHSPKSA